ncbi:pilus assembly protein CpaE [Agromyces sp. CF514]|uniref:AAA family ATPase n=1 Tax=Agromyces sp. CF514 TaxID=1881031 RepID=UPI0008E84318|nr:AAA family ATPase [Agromyces sp. CF514]SFR69136.1 pilus assembly protein CpaE [Agromyces sp. CF514]
MTPFLLVSRSPEYELRMRELLGARLRVVPGEFMLLGSESVVLRAGDPRIALLGPVLNFDETRSLVRELTERHPDVGVVLVREQRSELEDWVDELSFHAVLSPEASDATTLELIERLSGWLVDNGHAAVEDFEAPPLIDDELERLLAEAALVVAPEIEAPEIAEADGPDGLVQLTAATEAETDAAASATSDWDFPPLDSNVPSEAIAVVAPKGGQGKTTVSINLATGLADVALNSVVLVDADLQFGDITAALGLEPQRTIVDAVAAADDELVLKTTLTHHPDGFFVVASAPSPEFVEQVTPRALARLIAQLRGMFRYVVVDTTPGLGEHTLVAIEQVTDAVFVMNMGVPSLRAVRKEFELLEQVGLTPANRHTVLNFSDRQSGLNARDVERIIGTPIDVEVPRSSAVVLAANRGVPLVHDDVRDPAAKALRALVLRIAPDAHPTRSRIHRRRRNHEPQ